MVILASASPRRKELLSMAGVEYISIPAEVDETPPSNILPAELPGFLSSLKADAVSAKHPEDIVIGADTIVVIDDNVLGKPKDKDDAVRMLKSLSGRTHTVYTGVTITRHCDSKKISFTSSAQVEFYPLSDSEIDKYIATGDPFDKAGAYGIQSPGCVLVKGIVGDYFTVMGLPIAETVRRLSSF